MPELRRSHRRLARQSPARRFRGFPRAEGGSACPRCGGVAFGSRDRLRLVVSAGFHEPRVIPRARGAAESPSARAIVSGSSFRQVSTCRGWFHEPEVLRSRRRLARSAPARRFGRFSRAEGDSACPSSPGLAPAREITSGSRFRRISACRGSLHVPGPCGVARGPRRISSSHISGSRNPLRHVVSSGFHLPEAVQRAGRRPASPPARGICSGSRFRLVSTSRGWFRVPEFAWCGLRLAEAPPAREPGPTLRAEADSASRTSSRTRRDRKRERSHKSLDLPATRSVCSPHTS
ncbi:hypothetical protein EDF35_1168 [Rathayibacter sp. PhB151]|nr:hypothetical protein EDF35_1168 [Rathayibacter sp. PhB151]